MDDEPDPKPKTNFVRDIIDEHLRNGRFTTVHTRFPPEPNGYLHIGHAKSICLNFGLARDYKGLCNLRMDDTNPETEDMEYVNAIKEDVRWLGFDWEDREYLRLRLLRAALRVGRRPHQEGRGLRLRPDRRPGPRIPGHREQGRAGRAPTGTAPSRRTSTSSPGCGPASSPTARRPCGPRSTWPTPNMLLRDPLMYRIRREHHYRTGDAWCIYPTYDWAHGQSDSIEGVTHSICTLEFEVHRPLYDWYLDQLGVHHPQQIEFARLNLSHTVLSKRRLLELVEGGLVSGWDDPRMPTISGFRRRGFTPEAIAQFRRHHRRRQGQQHRRHAAARDVRPRAPEQDGAAGHGRPAAAQGRHHELSRRARSRNSRPSTIPRTPRPGRARSRSARELWIEREDFMEDPPSKFYRLAPGQGSPPPLRLLHQVRGGRSRTRPGTSSSSAAPTTRRRGAGTPPDGRKVKATLHWVSAAHAVDAEVRLYDTLFTVRDPASVAEGVDWKATLNPKSLEVIKGAKLEPGLAGAVAREPLAVRADGLFLRRPARFEARRARLQPHRDPPRRVGPAGQHRPREQIAGPAGTPISSDTSRTSRASG